jgi:hypothetical protein
MKRICLVGPVDKRAIVYPLIKCMMFLGKVLVVTDDSVLRRFSESYAKSFGFSNSEFLVESTINTSVLDYVLTIQDSFDFVLFVTTDELPSNCDKVLYCHGVEKSFGSSSTLKALENVEYTEIYITFSKLPDATVVKIEPSKTVMAYIFSCEESKEFLETSDASYGATLEKFFEKELAIPKKTISGLMRRKG